MKLLGTAWPVLLSLVALAAAGACSGSVSEIGSNRNWPCSADSDCRLGERCVEKRCHAVPRGPDAGVGGSANDEQGQSTTQYLRVSKGNAMLRTGTFDVGICLSMTMERDLGSGQIPCSVIDATEGRIGCDPALGLLLPAPQVLGPAMTALQEHGVCGVAGAPSCNSMSLCAVEEATGAALQSCLSGAALPIDSRAVWCYVDPDNGIGSAAAADKCTQTDTERRVLRTVLLSGFDSTVIACFGTHATPMSPGTAKGKIGDTFVPSDETKPNFGGFSPWEVTIETGSPSCESGVGLVYGFSGRTGCPYGQAADKTDPSRVDPAQQTCFTPSGAPVTAPVRAQMFNRRPSKSVYCSCRCDGPDTNVAYCDCPGGFECKKLLADYGFGSAELAGSYCFKSGTDLDPSIRNDRWCDQYSQNCAAP